MPERESGTLPYERVLVTGGAGFIGSHLTRRLLAEGATVRVLDNLSTGRASNLHDVISDVEFHEGDLRSPEAVARAVEGVDIVFHQAALPSVPRSVRDPRNSLECNVTGTLNVLLAARDAGIRRVVHASSSSVYGANPALPKEERLSPMPISPYAVGKLAAEGLCRSFTEVYGLETVALRYFNVFGPFQDPTSQYSAVIPVFVSALMRGERPRVYGDGTQTRDFTFVENVVNANLLAAVAGPDAVGRAFNIAAGNRVSVSALIEHLATELGVDADVEFGPVRDGEVQHSHADISSARAILGYDPHIGLEEAIGRTVAHYRHLDPDRRAPQ